MAKRINNDVTMSHEDAVEVSKMLSDYAQAQREHAKKTRNDAVRWECNRTADKAHRQADAIVRALYTWVDNVV